MYKAEEEIKIDMTSGQAIHSFLSIIQSLRFPLSVCQVIKFVSVIFLKRRTSLSRSSKRRTVELSFNAEKSPRPCMSATCGSALGCRILLMLNVPANDQSPFSFYS